jgi:hypothetical protein
MDEAITHHDHQQTTTTKDGATTKLQTNHLNDDKPQSEPVDISESTRGTTSISRKPNLCQRRRLKTISEVENPSEFEQCDEDIKSKWICILNIIDKLSKSY